MLYGKTVGRLQTRHSIRNVLQPTKSRYHFIWAIIGDFKSIYISTSALTFDLQIIFVN